MTPQYTATARIVIEPPAGADLRAAMAVSPIYLESLKTYEHFAASDSLFQKAVQQFGLAGRPIESLKRRVLKVQLVRNTRILEISATLPDAKKAQALAQFLAESTVEINRASVSESDQDLLRGIEQQARDCARDCRRPSGLGQGGGRRAGAGLAGGDGAGGGIAVEDRGAGAERGTGNRRPRRARQDRPPTRANCASRKATRARGWRDAQADCRIWTGRARNARNCWPRGRRIAISWRRSARRGRRRWRRWKRACAMRAARADFAASG